jgi:hypothetical protein
MLSPVADVEDDLAEWWQAVVETPLVIGGVTTLQQIDSVRGIADFARVEPDYRNDAAAAFVAEAIARLG